MTPHIPSMNKRLKNFKDEKLFKPLDLLIGVIIVVLIIVAVVFAFKPKGSFVEIYQSGEIIGKYSINSDNKIIVDGDNGRNVVVISGGKVFVLEADCKSQYCVRHNPVSAVGEQIVCLPNKLVIVIVGETEGELDGTT